MRFLNRVLRALDNIYSFEGPQTSVNEVDLGGSIQLVHDVSRQSAMGQGRGYAGFFNIRLATSHVGGAASNSTDTLFMGETAAFWNRIGFDARTSWLWCHEVSLTTLIDDADFTAAQVVVLQLDNGAEFQDLVRMIANWGNLTGQTVDAAGEFAGYNGAAAANYNPLIPAAPTLLPPDCTLRFQSRAVGTGQFIYCGFVLQATPRGIAPFGRF